MKFLPGEEFLPGWEPLGYTKYTVLARSLAHDLFIMRT